MAAHVAALPIQRPRMGALHWQLQAADMNRMEQITRHLACIARELWHGQRNKIGWHLRGIRRAFAGA